MNKKEGCSILGIVLVLALAASAPAAAQDSGVYLGASLGTGTSKNTCRGITGTCNETDTAYKLFGGYQVNRNFAWELGYGTLGGLQGSDHNTSFTWGLGLRFDLGRAYAVRAEWQHYPNIGGDNAGVDDIDLLTLGLVMRF